MPAQERSIQIDGRVLGGDQPQRQHREAMARNTSPKGSNPRAEAQISQWDDEAGWDHDHDEAAGHRARRLLSRSNSGFHRLGDNFAALQPLGHRRTLGQAPGGRDRRSGGDLCRLFRRALVAARRRTDQSRRGDAVACGRDRGQYRARQYGRGRRHADRAGGANSDRGAHPRHRGPRSRPRHRRQRAEGRGETIRHRAPDGAAARREPQSGRCRTRGADHAGRPGDGVRGDTAKPLATGVASKRDAGLPPTFPRQAPAPPGRRGDGPRHRRRTDCWPASTGSTASA